MINNFQNEVFIAPLAGITNEPFRIFLKSLGANVTFTEMISSEGLIRFHEKTLNMLKIKREKPIIIPQLFGSNPDIIHEAAKIVMNYGFNIVDINMGCPVKKVIKKGAGVKLMSSPETVKQIIKNLRKLPLKITAKIRLGTDKDNINYLEIIKILYNEGIDAVTIHPRTGDEFFKNNAKWEYIGEAKNRFPKLFIIGNGDIKSPEHIEKMFKLTNCNAVMIGRFACENPFIIRQWKEFKETRQYTDYSLHEKIKHFKTLFFLLQDFFNEKISLNLSKKYLILLTKGYHNSSSLRKNISKIKKCIEILDEIRYWENHNN